MVFYAQSALARFYMHAAFLIVTGWCCFTGMCEAGRSGPYNPGSGNVRYKYTNTVGLQARNEASMLGVVPGKETGIWRLHSSPGGIRHLLE